MGSIKNESYICHLYSLFEGFCGMGIRIRTRSNDHNDTFVA